MRRSERQDILRKLRLDAERIAGQFGLTYRQIEAEHPKVKSRYGVCYSDGLIKIRLNHARTGQALRYSSMVDTLCHELAHLRHFNHGPDFKRFFWQILSWAKREGIYSPSRRGTGSAASPQGDRFSAAPPPPLRCQLPLRNGVPVFPMCEPTHTAGGHAVDTSSWTYQLEQALFGACKLSVTADDGAAQGKVATSATPDSSASRPEPSCQQLELFH